MQYALLKECRDTLLRIRTLKHNELDPSVTTELDVVIDKMTLLLETAEENVAVDPALIERILTTIGRVAIGLDWLRRIIEGFSE